MSQYKPVSWNLFVDFAYDISFQEFIVFIKMLILERLQWNVWDLMKRYV